eukprot:4743263-Pleurochrysis_carterae.AAC.1
MGVATGDDASLDAGAVARFLCAAAEDGGQAEAVQAALAAAAAADGNVPDEGEAGATGAADDLMAQAGKVCVTALRGSLDALG